MSQWIKRGLQLGLSIFVALFLCVPPVGAQETEPELESLGQEELSLMGLDLRRGKSRQVGYDLDEILEELPEEYMARCLRAEVRFLACDYAAAEEDAREALKQALRATRAKPEEISRCARRLAAMLFELGRSAEAQAALEQASAALRPDLDARDAWMLGQVLLDLGQRDAAMERFRQGASAAGVPSWDALLDQARCLRALGNIRAAATTLTVADKLARDGMGVEADILVELGNVYFEAYGEVNDSVSKAHSPAKLYQEALRLNPDHEGARLGLFALARFNWRRTRYGAAQLLGDILDTRPASIAGLVASASASIDNGDLRSARVRIKRLEGLAGGRRDVQTVRATLAWIENKNEESLALLRSLVKLDPGDSVPERTVGRHLLELYRFAEALGFLERSIKRNPKDWRAQIDLGRAQANTGDEVAARLSLSRAVELAEGRKNAWRDNMLLVLKRMHEGMTEHKGNEISYAWLPDAAPVLERYLIPFYSEAREELAARYGFTPGHTRIEVFREWTDFSVRSTGFAGFPALGVCFGPVVTSVSPLSELRGQFSWARTSFHEFTHVIHLGLSHNRCPRWVTEGLATWEEGSRSASWWRNLRREMHDSLANATVVPVRHLNGAFRGPRVIFAYYQSGLLCKMLIEKHGFAPMVRFLEAFDQGADLDQALQQVFRVSPEALDVEFRAFVEGFLGELKIEPRWDRSVTFQRRFGLKRTPPETAKPRLAWQEDWCRVAWGAYWSRELVDAEEALRVASLAGELPARGLFLRGEMLLQETDIRGAERAYKRGFELGGDDFRARMAAASIALQKNEPKLAEEHLLAAEIAFPGYDDRGFNAELKLAELYDEQGRSDEAAEARLRWLNYNAGEFDTRVLVASWLDTQGRQKESVEIWREANEVDPFRRGMHLAWGKALRSLGRHDEALREFEVGLLVPVELDGDLPRQGAGHVSLGSPHDEGIAFPDVQADAQPIGADPFELWRSWESVLEGYRALSLVALERPDEARGALERALALDATCEPALEAKALLGD